VGDLERFPRRKPRRTVLAALYRLYRALLEHLDDPREALRVLRESCDRIAVEVPDLDSMRELEVRRRVGAPYYWDDDHVSDGATCAARSEDAS
jgi:hypothetical protein